MSLTLLSAGALAALVALAVPLLIHLVRRSAQRLVDFAALRWISARQRPQRRLVFDEKLLLGLRLLVLALLALFLAQPVWREAPSAQAWVAVVPGVELASAQALALPEQAEWRWLAPGFAPVGTTPPAPVHVSSLLRELDARLPASASLAVVTPSILEGVDGERPRLGRSIDWRVAAGAPFASHDASPAPPAPRVAIRHAAGSGDATRYLDAAMRAWHPRQEMPPPDIAATLARPGAGADVLFWLHPGTVPDELLAWAAAGRTLVIEPGADTEGAPEGAVVSWRDADGAPLATAEPLGDGRLVRLQRPLRPAQLPEMLQPEFPAVLRALLQPSAAPTVAPAETHAPLRASWNADGDGLDVAVRSLQAWLALLIASLLLLERWLATRVQRWRP